MKVDPGILCSLLALLVLPAGAACHAAEYLTPNSKVALPRFSELDDRARESLRAESRAKTASQGVLQTLNIIDLAKQLRDDPRYAASPTLQQTRGRLTARLRTVKKRTLAARREKQRPQKIEISRTALAQLNAAFNARRGGANVNQVNLGGGPADYGPMLVTLIQDTISPQSWDVNGGSSTIRYWRPGWRWSCEHPKGCMIRSDQCWGSCDGTSALSRLSIGVPLALRLPALCALKSV